MIGTPEETCSNPSLASASQIGLLTYTFKNTADDLKTGKNLPPPL